ncbi:MAG TPA: addiction module antidote protein [Caulobacteraceae bacterium]|jgi:probable addiction module antidote protein|nr:addiction module antidote protein [Caulobacteraceae bacterium]
MAVQTTRFDAQRYLATRKDEVAYLEAALEDGDPSLIAAVLGDIARAHGAVRFAKETGLSRETIYKALKPGGNPTLDTLAKAVKALNLRLTLTAAEPRHPGDDSGRSPE